MKSPAVYQVSLVTSLESEDAVSESMHGLLGTPPSAYSREGALTSTVTCYLPDERLKPESTRRLLQQRLKQLSDLGLPVGPARILIKRVRQQDWANSWKRHSRPINIAGRLLVRPSWSKRQPRKGQAVVTLDPGLSFGTGQHPTTRFCLEQLVARRKTGQQQTVLDIGTGSGILAIAAVKVGYHRVRALDNDPVAVRVARANAQANGIAGAHLTIETCDLAQLPRRAAIRYDLVCANLIEDLLLDSMPRIINRVRRQGTLVLAGLLARQFAKVQASYRRAGMILEVTRREGEWESGAFVWQDQEECAVLS